MFFAYGLEQDRIARVVLGQQICDSTITLGSRHYPRAFIPRQSCILTIQRPYTVERTTAAIHL